MNIAEFSIKKSVITWTLTIVMLVLGYFSYQSLPRLEDPEFAIKDGVVITTYPGASPQEVEEEVTEQIEKAVQELGQLRRIESYSERGLSKVKVTIDDKYSKDDLPQIWDELRKKVGDYQKNLPPGAGTSVVVDDFGDVYGIYYGLTGDGYSMAEIKKVAELLKRELLVVQDVKKIVLFGEQKEAVYVEMSKSKMASLGITRDEIFSALQAKNLVADAGKLQIGSEYMAINPTGIYKSEKDFGDLLISSKGGKLIFLRDVATIRRDYVDPPKNILRFNGEPAIGIAISTKQGGNAVIMGEGVTKRLGELEDQIPVGVELNIISMQSDTVTESINGFIINLLEAVAIVVIILLIFMGLRSGLIIGFILLLTIALTFFVMDVYAITLERISLGALIIALGMLVDNAIVIVDGMKIKMESGMDGLQAAKEVVGQNSIPLLGATAVAVLAFASIGSMENSTGEYTRSLYYVILISLSLSWLTAVTSTPLLTKLFVLPKKSKKSKKSSTGEVADPYGGKFYQIYKNLLAMAIKFRWITIGIVVGMFILSLVGFGFVKTMFFPPSTRPQFMVECQFREGTHLRETEKGVAKIEEYLKKFDGITDVASAVGAGHSRFLLTYDVPVDASKNYCNILVGVEDYSVINKIFFQVQDELEAEFPDVTINVRKFNLGPANGGKIQLRINGPDRAVLRDLADKAMRVLKDDPGTKAIRTEWGDQVKVIVPVLAEDKARRLGISRQMVAQAIQSNFSGTTTGVYREGIELIPIIARAPESERLTIENMRDLQIYSPIAGQNIPLLQVVNRFETVIEDSRISRRQRRSMIKLHCDARTELNSEVFARVKPKIEQLLNVDVATILSKDFGDGDPFAEHTAKTITVVYDDILPLKGMPGYFISWSGESEDSADSQAKLGASVPMFFGMMVLMVIFLFNAFKQPIIIWLTVPLSLIGVVMGLLLLDQAFGFMALLGLMSLSGMLIKNAIVLIDQIDTNIKSGMDKYDSVVQSGVSRLSPVSLAALTTMMGMIPLFQDDFFISMAVTIVFGLGFATILTLLVVPVLYATFFKIPTPNPEVIE
jgi:multidrug efflux pump subunit AcrB